MIETIVRYLRSQNVPFRLQSFGSPELLPEVAYKIPADGQLIDTRVLLVEGRPTIAVMPAGRIPDFAALGSELDALVIEGKISDLPPPFDRATLPLPPLGGALGVPTIVDQGVSRSALLVFRAFSPHDFFELVERPRVASFAVKGELEPSREAVGT